MKAEIVERQPWPTRRRAQDPIHEDIACLGDSTPNEHAEMPFVPLSRLWTARYSSGASRDGRPRRQPIDSSHVDGVTTGNRSRCGCVSDGGRGFHGAKLAAEL